MERIFDAEKFQKYLKLLEDKTKNEPGALVKKPVTGSERTLLVPKMFYNLETTIRELETTPLPESSSLLITYAKAGTHWVCEIMKMLKTQNPTHDDNPKESAHFDMVPPSFIREIHGESVPVYVTHLPMWCIPPSSYVNVKTVFVYRNPKDSLVSFYHHVEKMSKVDTDLTATIAEYFETYMSPSEKVFFGNWFDHLAEYWDSHRSNPNFLWLTFEELKKDPVASIKRIDAHLGTGASESLIEEIAEATSFHKMKDGKSDSERFIQGFNPGTMYRRGEVGDWKNHLSEEQNRRMNERIQAWQNERSVPVPLIFEI